MGILKVGPTAHEQVDVARAEGIGIDHPPGFRRIVQGHGHILLARKGEASRKVHVVINHHGQIFDRHPLEFRRIAKIDRTARPGWNGERAIGCNIGLGEIHHVATGRGIAPVNFDSIAAAAETTRPVAEIESRQFDRLRGSADSVVTGSTAGGLEVGQRQVDVLQQNPGRVGTRCIIVIDPRRPRCYPRSMGPRRRRRLPRQIQRWSLSFFPPHSHRRGRLAGQRIE